MKYNLEKIFRNFQIDANFIDACPYGSGHINDTFDVTSHQNGSKLRYIFQRINHNIFKNPPRLMENIIRVTSHLREKLKVAQASDIDRKVITIIPARDGQGYYIDEQENYWRVYIFIEKAQTYDVMQNLDQAFQAAKAFGQFQKMLVDLPKPPLFETIPDFHNGPKRFRDFLDALQKDICNRAQDCQAEIEYLLKNAWIFDVLPKLVEEGKIPIRITHNDTKINNVMIDDETNEGICAIDLDTVMPGLALYDFGDILRTTLSPSEEDERDLSKVGMQMPRFEAVLRGYLSSAGDFLNQAERDHLVFSGQMITLTIGTRFLTDHLAGDAYFKIHRDNQNLDRCRTQFKLVQSISENQQKMNKLVKRVSNQREPT